MCAEGERQFLEGGAGWGRELINMLRKLRFAPPPTLRPHHIREFLGRVAFKRRQKLGEQQIVPI